MINMDKVQWLLEDSDVTGYQISKQSGVSQTLIGKYRSEDYDLDNMTVETARQLTDAAVKIWNAKVAEAAQYVDMNRNVDTNLSMVDVMTTPEFKKTLLSDLKSIQEDSDEQFTTFDEYDIRRLLQNDYESGYVIYIALAPEDGATSYAADFTYDNVEELSRMPELNHFDKQFFKNVLSILPYN